MLLWLLDDTLDRPAAAAVHPELRAVDARGRRPRDRTHADPAGADLHGADLHGADLLGADLLEALFLARTRVCAAPDDGRTLLPAELERPGRWRGEH